MYNCPHDNPIPDSVPWLVIPDSGWRSPAVTFIVARTRPDDVRASTAQGSDGNALR